MYQVYVHSIPEITVNLLSVSTIRTPSLALTIRHTFGFIKKIGRSTDILDTLALFCSLLSECDRFLQLLRSFPNITVQDLSSFVFEVFKKMHVILGVSPSYDIVKSTSKNWLLEPILIECIVTAG